MPAPGLVYYYPTAIPLNGAAAYGAAAGVMAAAAAGPTPMVRYRAAAAAAGAYMPGPPEMMDYTALYNGVSRSPCLATSIVMKGQSH